MPAHDPQLKDKEYVMHVLIVEKKTWDHHVPDGHASIKFEWRGGTHSWFIEGVQAPQTHLLDPKHNWHPYESNLPQSQGDAILRLMEWVQGLSSNV